MNHIDTSLCMHVKHKVCIWKFLMVFNLTSCDICNIYQHIHLNDVWNRTHIIFNLYCFNFHVTGMVCMKNDNVCWCFMCYLHFCGIAYFWWWFCKTYMSKLILRKAVNKIALLTHKISNTYTWAKRHQEYANHVAKA